MPSNRCGSNIAPASWTAPAERSGDGALASREAERGDVAPRKPLRGTGKRHRASLAAALQDIATPPAPQLCLAPSLSAPNLWVLLLFLLLPLPAAEPQNTSAIQSLKPGPGREQVQINCIPCHSTAIITATHATRERWDELITTMQQKHGLWPLIPTIRKQLLDYLAATQPPSDPGLDAGKQNPWAQPLYRPNPLW